MRVESMVMSWQQGSFLILSKSVGGTGDEIDIAREQRRDAGGGLLDRREHYAIDIAGRGLVPIVGEALELELHPLLALGDDERSCARHMARGEGRAVLGDVVLGPPRSSVPV